MTNTFDWQLNAPDLIPGVEKPFDPRIALTIKPQVQAEDCFRPDFVKHPVLYDIHVRNL